MFAHLPPNFFLPHRLFVHPPNIRLHDKSSNRSICLPYWQSVNSFNLLVHPPVHQACPFVYLLARLFAISSSIRSSFRPFNHPSYVVRPLTLPTDRLSIQPLDLSSVYSLLRPLLDYPFVDCSITSFLDRPSGRPPDIYISIRLQMQVITMVHCYIGREKHKQGWKWCPEMAKVVVWRCCLCKSLLPPLPFLLHKNRKRWALCNFFFVVYNFGKKSLRNETLQAACSSSKINSKIMQNTYQQNSLSAKWQIWLTTQSRLSFYTTEQWEMLWVKESRLHRPILQLTIIPPSAMFTKT